MTQDGEHHFIDGVWDLIIAHPPCTYLTVSGNAWFSTDRYNTKAKARYMDRVDAIKFFMNFVVCNAKKVVIENPVGIMSNVYKKPDQIISPHEYGSKIRKKTCLWLKGVNPLEPTDIVEPELVEYTKKDGTKTTFSKAFVVGLGGERSKVRSKTEPGIAKAMAEQWG